MHIYLAGPFFKASQIATIAALEDLLSSYNPKITFYSPRHDGVLMDMTPEERKKNSKKIFDLNCTNMNRSQMILAVIDDRDVGTIFELGYCCGSKRLFNEMQIVTYTEQNYGMNVMLKECVNAHLRGMIDAKKFFNGLVEGDPRVWSKFKNFEEVVT